jgi:hypothetical protein
MTTKRILASTILIQKILSWTYLRGSFLSVAVHQEMAVCHPREHRTPVSMEGLYHLAIVINLSALLVTIRRTVRFTPNVLPSLGPQIRILLKEMVRGMTLKLS